MGTAITRKWSRLGWAVLTYLLVLLLIFPVLWMVITAFKTEVEAIAIPPTLFFVPTLSQFALASNLNEALPAGTVTVTGNNISPR